MNPRINKKPLNFERYDSYGISQDYMAYEIIVSDISEAEWDNLEADYQAQGYKIFNSLMEREHAGSFKCSMIIAKMGFVF